MPTTAIAALKVPGGDAAQELTCRGYVEDAMAVAQGYGGTVAGGRVRMPPHVNVGQVKDIAVRFLQEHPEQRQFVAAYLVASALAEAFPCPPGATQPRP